MRKFLLVYKKQEQAMLVIHIHRGQNPINRITESVNEDVPVAI